MAKKTSVGGQAVIEGVMMRGEKGIATAVRTPDGKIAVEFEEKIPYVKKYKALGIPIIRGVVSLVESLIVGISTLNYSASFFEEENTEPSKFDNFLNKIFKGKAADVIVGISFLISLAFAILIFVFIPNVLAQLFKKLNIVNNTIGLNLIEGIIRVAIFIVYIMLVGKMEDIKRTFEYHGAEHKTIFCYENEKELTPENASKFGRLHPRCGTNFLFLVMIVSIIVLSFTGWNSLIERILYRILLIPLIAGITYEIIKWMGRSESKLSKIIAYPGLMLQKLTTREPDYSQLEVAIKALKVAEGLESPEENEEETENAEKDEKININEAAKENETTTEVTEDNSIKDNKSIKNDKEIKEEQIMNGKSDEDIEDQNIKENEVIDNDVRNAEDAKL